MDQMAIDTTGLRDLKKKLKYFTKKYFGEVISWFGKLFF